MSEINLEQCNDGKNNFEKILPTPLTCGVHDLHYQDMHPNYKGPFINKSTLMVPSSDTKPTSVHALMALSLKNIPSSFSWYKTGGNKIENGSRNQGNCGCCWAMSAVSALGDRYALKYNIAAPYPGALMLVSCGGPTIGTPAKQQCTCGGSSYAGSLWLEDNGVKLEECWPYTTFQSSPQNDSWIAPNCPKAEDNCCASCCGNSAAKPVFSVKKGSTKYLIIHDDNNVANLETTTRAIQNDILTYGPVVATFWVPPDFQSWWQQNAGTDKIYIPSGGSKIGVDGHAVVLSGWGEEGGVKYWEFRNTWGLPGYCRFAMSLSTPQENWTGIDVPTFTEGGWWAGGCVSFQAGPLSLSSYNWVAGHGGSPSSTKGMIGNVNWVLIGVIAAILLILVLIVIVVS